MSISEIDISDYVSGRLDALEYPSGEGRLVKALETSPSSDVLS